MFGTAFGHVPFYKGLVMQKFSDYNSYTGFRTNLNKIEGLQITSGYVWTGNPETLTYLEAEELIIKLKENEIKTDPKDQYQEMFRSGMFNG